MKFKQALVALAASIALLPVASHAAAVIDNFDVAQTLLVDNLASDGTGVASEVMGATTDIIGGYRDLYINKTATSNSSTENNTGGSASVGGGELLISSASRTTAVAIVRWDGDSAANSMNGLGLASALGSINATGLGGANLNMAGIGFLLSTTSDLDFSITFEAYTDAGNWSSVTKTGAAATFFSFAEFALAGNIQAGSGVDFSNVGALQMVINLVNPVERVDLSVDIISAVPEPGSLALAGLALMGLAAARRRKA